MFKQTGTYTEALLVKTSFSCIFEQQPEGDWGIKSDIMTMEEVADYLKLKLKTAYAIAARGDIPGFKVGGSWRFRRSEIEKWIKRQEAGKKA